MNPHRLIVGSLPVIVLTALVFPMSWASLPDVLRMIRTVMMILGGLVVIAIVLVVAIAIISGVMGMIGRLRKRNDWILSFEFRTSSYTLHPLSATRIRSITSYPSQRMVRCEFKTQN